MVSNLESVALKPTPDLRYRNLDAAVGWIGDKFGFEQHKTVSNAGGESDYVEVTYGSGQVILGSWSDETDARANSTVRSDKTFQSQSCYLLVTNIDDLRARVEHAGVEVVFDSRASGNVGNTFVCRDLEENLWFFGDANDEIAGRFPIPPEMSATAPQSRGFQFSLCSRHL